MILTGKNEELEDGSVALPLCPTQIPLGNSAVVYLKQTIRKYNMKVLHVDSSVWV
jgi:hypothetical protein